MTTIPTLSADEVRAALDPAAAVDALLAALRGGYDPRTDHVRHLVDVGHGQLFLMPSEAGDVVGVKVLGLAPENAAHGLPRIQGFYLLFDGTTLTPRAILDGAALTTLRTAAVSFAAIRDALLAREGDLDVVIFGRGPQAESHLATLRRVCDDRRRIGSVTTGTRDTPVDPDVLRRAGLVICASTARTPLFSGSGLGPDAIVVAVGSHEPTVRELDAATLRGAHVVVETRDAALREAGDIVLGIDEGAITVEDLVELADVATGRHALPAAGRIVFKSVGMSWEDLVLADAVLSGWDRG